jgi:hypothetical protein
MPLLPDLNFGATLPLVTRMFLLGLVLVAIVAGDQLETAGSDCIGLISHLAEQMSARSGHPFRDVGRAAYFVHPL